MRHDAPITPEAAFIKRLIAQQETTCPECGTAMLEHEHKRAAAKGRDRLSYVCPSCGKRFNAVKLMEKLKSDPTQE
jgi:transposase-like protein